MDSIVPLGSVLSTVDSITGGTTSGTETFFASDPSIGQPVNFGVDTCFAGTKKEFFDDAAEPLALLRRWAYDTFTSSQPRLIKARPIGRHQRPGRGLLLACQVASIRMWFQLR